MRYCTLVIVALMLAIGMAAIPETAHAQGGPCFGRDPLSREYVAWSGPWIGHGARLDVYQEGCGVMTQRTYLWCAPGKTGPGCDWMTGNLIQFGSGFSFTLDIKDGKAASGHILPLAYSPSGEGVVLRLAEDGTLDIAWDDDGPAGRTLCRPWLVTNGQCGA